MLVRQSYVHLETLRNQVMDTIFTVIQETDKAMKIKYPYYERTSEYKSKHKQKYVEQWIPKSVKNIEQWVESKMKERGFNMNFIGIGIAPTKELSEPLIMPDYDKIKAHYDVFYDKVFSLTGQKPHYISGFEANGACFDVDGKVYDFEQEYDELKLYKPTIITKRYK